VKSKRTKQRRSPRLTTNVRRLIETLAAFANLKPEDAAAFQGGVLKFRNGSDVVSNFLPEICWELPAPSPSPGSPLLSEGLLGWQEIQQLVRALWDSTPPFRSHRSAYNRIVSRLKLYSMIAALPVQERESLRTSTLDPMPPMSTDDWLRKAVDDPNFLADHRRRPYDFNRVGPFRENRVGPPREPREEEYKFVCWLYTPTFDDSICPCEHAVWFMLFNGWRAKSCRKCLSRYIALEQQSRYCSNDCSSTHRTTLNKVYRNKSWAKNGKKWRQNSEKARRKAKER
jgi:hypothetical protein